MLARRIVGIHIAVAVAGSHIVEDYVAAPEGDPHVMAATGARSD